MNKFPFFIGILFSSIFIVIGAWFLSNNLDLLENGVKTEGTVVNLREGLDAENNRIYYPVVEFTTEHGNLHTGEVKFGSSPPAYDIGDPIHIVYPKGKPNELSINTTFWMYIFPSIFISLGGLFQFIILIVFIKLSRKNVHKSESKELYNTDNEEDDEPIYKKKANNDKNNPFLLD